MTLKSPLFQTLKEDEQRKIIFRVKAMLDGGYQWPAVEKRIKSTRFTLRAAAEKFNITLRK
jgi:hypothetical protein